MTIDEAVEIQRKQPHEVSISDSIQARFTLATEYLRITDPTPLTVANAEVEIGERSADDYHGQWKFENTTLWVYDNEIWLGDELVTMSATLGDLRQIVAMLRGGGA